MAAMKTTKPPQIASCTFALDATGRAQLLPSGEFRAGDGRPEGVPAWLVNDVIAAQLIADLSARKTPVVVDYEHQTLNSEENGQPAPAAGWMQSYEWVPGDGLYATVEWTARARVFIESGEYKYISPVFLYDPKTGVVTKIINAALTNYPAIDGMDAVLARRSADFLNLKGTDMDMDELLERIRYLLNLPTLATPVDVAEELQKAVDMIKAGAATDAVAATRLGVVGMVTAQKGELATLRQSLASAQSELLALKEAHAMAEVDALVQAALKDFKISPAQVDAMKSLGKQDLALLRQVIDHAVPVVANFEAAGAEYDAQVAATKVVLPSGYSADAAQVVLRDKARSYAKQHGCDFVTAVKAVS